MVKIFIDSKEYPADPEKNLLEVCLSHGLNLPYFCWHPAMGSVGACRQCAVKSYRDEKDTKGRLVMACMEPVRDGMRIGLVEQEAKEFRRGIIEWLMTNHPHDCPICDEGGECHLQDMTVMTGHDYRRYRFNKRSYHNQYLGPFVNHEMNRCIQCYRCVRYYRDYAGGRDFDNFSIRNQVYFGRHEDGVLESEFSGNLVEICPTGVFTDKTLQNHYTRKWDFTSAPSICTHCSLGCNTIAGERYGSLRRIRSRFNGAVNGYFLCDRGRYGYEFVNSPKRILEPVIKNLTESIDSVTPETLKLSVHNILSGSKRIIGIGSPRASLESNYALFNLVGKENFFQGIPEREQALNTLILDILRNGPARSPSMNDIENCDAVLILGEDLTNTAPMFALALRQSVRLQPMKKIRALKIPEWQDAAVREAMQDEKGPLFVASPYETKLDEIATQTFRAAPDDIARLGFAIAAQINPGAPAISGSTEQINLLAESIAAALKTAERPLIISGTGTLNAQVIKAAANIAWSLYSKNPSVQLSFTFPYANSMGLAMLGGGSLNDAFSTVSKHETDTVIILETDIFRNTEKEMGNKFLSGCKHVIVLDSMQSETTVQAEIVVPVGTFAESDGTFVNNEGRAQRFYQVYPPSNHFILESWRWLNEFKIIKEAGEKPSSFNFYDLVTKLSEEIPLFKGIEALTPPPDFRIAGEKIPREPHRYSGRTAMYANKSVHEPKPPVDADSPLSFTMEGYRGQPPSSIIPFFWAPGWNSVQSINKYQIEVGGPLHGGDPGKRLIEPTINNGNIEFYTDIPTAFIYSAHQWLVLPVYHIYGSEELSSAAAAVSELITEPYAALSLEDAAQLKITKNETLQISIDNKDYSLPVKLKLGLPKGIIALPLGLPGMPFISLPAWGKIISGNT